MDYWKTTANVYSPLNVYTLQSTSNKMADQPPVKDLQTIQKNVNDIVQRIFDQFSDENSGVTNVSIEKKIKTKKDLALLAFDLFDNLIDVKSAFATI